MYMGGKDFPYEGRTIVTVALPRVTLAMTRPECRPTPATGTSPGVKIVATINAACRLRCFAVGVTPEEAVHSVSLWTLPTHPSSQTGIAGMEECAVRKRRERLTWVKSNRSSQHTDPLLLTAGRLQIHDRAVQVLNSLFLAFLLGRISIIREEPS